MAGQTTRFALNFFGGDTPGAFEDDNQKYTGEDRLVIDRILSALENHNHRVTTLLDTPDDTPAATLSLLDGSLNGGTYYYCVSFVNADGLETVAGPETSVDTPEPLIAPDAPACETSTVSGASLTPGLYYYALTGLRGDEESALGSPDACTVLSTENTVTLTLPALDDATSFQIWRMKSSDAGWTRIGTSTTTTFVDSGTVPAGTYGNPANIPPSANTGTGSYAVQVTLTGDDLTRVTTASAWRLYRTDVSGIYGAASLVHEVIERTDDTDVTSPLLTSWVDDGDTSLTGSPKLFSTELSVPAFTFEHASGTLPAASGYPDYYPIIDSSGDLFVAVAGVWTPLSGSGGGGAGPTGPTGPSGATGASGASGASGATGPIGQTGPSGSSSLTRLASATDIAITTGTVLFGSVLTAGSYLRVLLQGSYSTDDVDARLYLLTQAPGSFVSLAGLSYIGGPDPLVISPSEALIQEGPNTVGTHYPFRLDLTVHNDDTSDYLLSIRASNDGPTGIITIPAGLLVTYESWTL